MKIEAKATKPLAVTRKADTDSVTVGYGSTTGLCGNIVYTLLDEKLLPAPYIIKVVYTAGEETYELQVDTSSYSKRMN